MQTTLEQPIEEPIYSRAWLSALSTSILLSGCSNVPLLRPGGPIGESERFVIIIAFVLMLIVVIPVIVMALWFPRKYRASDPQKNYDPKWSHSARIDLIVWLIPAIIVLVLGSLTWRESHLLDPSRPIDSVVKPINVEVVSLDWKWLFIYPELNIATLNQLVIPVNIPINFTITSDTVMTSFFIPQLGSQIYAMAGKQSHLHLLADKSGIYNGQNQQFSGLGFADMYFQVRAITPQQFSGWVRQTRQSPNALDLNRYKMIRQTAASNAVQSFSSVKHGLFKWIVNRYRHSSARQPVQAGTGKAG
jgi:cytochrome o ubiquinol oxidase subunit 2